MIFNPDNAATTGTATIYDILHVTGAITVATPIATVNAPNATLLYQNKLRSQFVNVPWEIFRRNL